MYKFRPFVTNNIKNITAFDVFANPHSAAIDIVEHEILTNPLFEIDWVILCYNPKAIHLVTRELAKSPNNIMDVSPEMTYRCWRSLCSNNEAIDIIKKELERDKNSPNINWVELYKSPMLFILGLYDDNYRILYWSSLCMNPHPEAINIIMKYPNEIYWPALCRNSAPKALDMLEENLNDPDLHNRKTNLYWLSLNSSPRAVNIIEKLITDMNSDILELILCNVVYDLLLNPNCIHIIEKHWSDVEFVGNNERHLLQNPSIFIYDYDNMKLKKQQINQSVIEYVYHPDRL